MTTQQYSLIIESVIWFGIGLAAFLLTFTFDDKIALYRYGANTWPAVVSVLIMIATAIRFCYCFLFSHTIKKEENQEEHALLRDMGPVFAIPTIYVLSLPYIGFYAGTLIFLPLYTYLIRRKDLLKVLFICVPTICLLEIIFTKFLFVPFPVGTLPFFYTFNSEVVNLFY
ncbi:MAG: tripartite tricarboxylate transporter TctB family protein [Desulfovibrio sp.]|jgi:hypothetical protein|nr:tripartite tricarboxylate transporter TctB family protein [Desulfovibrio sp.]